MNPPPSTPQPGWQARLSTPLARAAALPAGFLGDAPCFPTGYRRDRLLVSGLAADVAEVLADAACLAGGRLEADPEHVPVELAETPEQRAGRSGRLGTAGGALGLRRLRLRAVDPTAPAPDAADVLHRARVLADGRLPGVGLDHVVLLTPLGANPFHGSNPFHGFNPFHGSNPYGVGSQAPIQSYAVPGSGGLQPVAWAGPAPARAPDTAFAARRRPVVALLDSGCGAHPWLDRAVQHGVTCDGEPIGLVDPALDPQTHPDLVGPLDGGTDPASGHGTFVAGLVHQACPDADLLVWRAVAPDGSVDESDLVTALTRIAQLVTWHAAGDPRGRPVDVLNLSMGYYHETPTDGLFDPTMSELLAVLGRCGTQVVCSAGNDATDRPMFPAAFAPWASGTPAVPEPDGTAEPVLAVGALNPDLSSVALFSNDGPWVGAWAPGAAVVSTVPSTQGGLQPAAATRFAGRPRASIDPDGFGGGFAVWSGTSFAAPLVAGALAAALQPDLPAPGAQEPRESARARVRAARTLITTTTTAAITSLPAGGTSPG